MKSLINAGVAQPMWDNDLTLTSTKVKYYEPLLYKIAINFGFGVNETSDIVQQVYAEANRINVEQEHPRAIRICLSKLMIYKCIFIISNKFFSQNTWGGNCGTSFKYYSECKSSLIESSDMPLSYGATYILNHNIGFTEAEVSELLNITPIKVKERINKARSFINSFKG